VKVGKWEAFSATFEMKKKKRKIYKNILKTAENLSHLPTSLSCIDNTTYLYI